MHPCFFSFFYLIGINQNLQLSEEDHVENLEHSKSNVFQYLREKENMCFY